jgi:hypothetical protein
MSVTFDAEGTITITLAAGPLVLSRPTLGQYRKLRDLYNQAHQAMMNDLKQADEIKDNQSEHTDEEAIAFLDSMRDRLETWHHMWLISAASELSNGLPGDVDAWPADFALDQTLPSRMLKHWRLVPLARGSNPTS